jgi:hypothetical protein
MSPDSPMMGPFSLLASGYHTYLYALLFSSPSLSFFSFLFKGILIKSIPLSYLLHVHQGSQIRIYDVHKSWNLRKDISACSLRWTITDTALSPDQHYLVSFLSISYLPLYISFSSLFTKFNNYSPPPFFYYCFSFKIRKTMYIFYF